MQNFALPATLRDVPVPERSPGTFGAELERRRGLAHLSANQAAKLAGITGQTWRDVERGKGTRRATIIAMASAVQWDIDDALDWVGEPPAEESERRRRAADPRDVIDQNWPKLTDQQRAAAARMVETMADPFAPHHDPEGSMDKQLPGVAAVRFKVGEETPTPPQQRRRRR